MTSLEIYNPRMTYNTAAIDYDTTSVDFWRYAAVETVQRLGLVPGGSLLDVACGPGPAALAAAERVGSHGSVLGVDIAEEMIALAREHAAEAPAPQAEFVVGSMDDLDVGADRFDAATCVFGIFFARDVRCALVVRSRSRRLDRSSSPRSTRSSSRPRWPSIRASTWTCRGTELRTLR